MSIPKRQHTVPRVYLEKFVDEDKRLTLFSKRRKKQTRPTPKDALIRSFYYSQPLEGVQNAEHGVETKLFGEIETKYPTLYDQLIHDKPVDLDTLFLTLLMMRSRSPAFREAFEIGLADMVDNVYKNIPASEMPEPPSNMPDIWDKVVVTIDPHRSLIAMAHYIKTYCNAIAASSFSVVKAPRAGEFYTSDNPVVWFEKGFNLTDRPLYPNQPTASTRLVFPLNRKLAVVGRPRIGSEPIFRRGIREFSKHALREANEVQIACAWDEIVGNGKIPRIGWRYCTNKALKLDIARFNPEDDTFELSGTALESIRKKSKYRAS